MTFRLLALTACVVLSAIVPTAQAGISLNTTRVIFEGKSQEASVVIRNGGSSVLAQSWLEGLDSGGDPPFALTPSLVKINADQQQLLRIMYQGEGLPVDKESAFWLNVQEVPVETSVNTLQFAVRQKIKVFYRPPGLPGSSAAAPAALSWRVIEGEVPTLRISNPTAYHVSIVDMKARGATDGSLNRDALMIAPGAEIDLTLQKKPSAGTRLDFDCINDFGARDRYEVLLDHGPATFALERKG